MTIQFEALFIDHEYGEKCFRKYEASTKADALVMAQETLALYNKKTIELAAFGTPDQVDEYILASKEH